MVRDFFNRLEIVFLTGLLCCLPASTALAEMPATVVTVHMRNGKMTKGLVDADTDKFHLVLRRASANVVLRTRVPWMSVSLVTADEWVLSAEQMKLLIPQLSSMGSRTAFNGSSFIKDSRPYWIAGDTAALASRGGVVSVAVSDRSGDIHAARSVKSLQLVTQLANWDSDAAIDGLLVEIRPLDQFGQLVPVDGQLNLKLLGLSRTPGGQVQPGLSPVEFPELATWTQAVHKADFMREGAIYRLEFRGFRPERDLSIDPVGMISARLVVPGTGTFAASEGLTVLRPYSPIRDFHQMFRGTRTLPREVRD